MLSQDTKTHTPCVKSNPMKPLRSVLVAPCVLIDRVLPSVVRLSHTLVIVGVSQLRPPVIHGLLCDKGQRMERILICRDQLTLTGSMLTFYARGACIQGMFTLFFFVSMFLCNTFLICLQTLQTASPIWTILLCLLIPVTVDKSASTTLQHEP